MSGTVIAALVAGGILIVGGIGSGIYYLTKKHKAKKLKAKEENIELTEPTEEEYIETEYIEIDTTDMEVDTEYNRLQEKSNMNKKDFDNFLRLLGLIEVKESIKFDFDFKLDAINKVNEKEDFRLKLKNLRNLLKLEISSYKKEYLDALSIENNTVEENLTLVEIGSTLTVSDKENEEGDEPISDGSYLGHDDIEELMDVLTVPDMEKIINRVEEEVEFESSLVYPQEEEEKAEEPRYSGSTSLSLKDGTPVYVTEMGIYVLSDGTIVDDADVLEDGEPIELDEDYNKSLLPEDYFDFLKDDDEDEKKVELEGPKKDEVVIDIEEEDLIEEKSMTPKEMNDALLITLLDRFRIPTELKHKLLEEYKIEFRSKTYINSFTLNEDHTRLIAGGRTFKGRNAIYRIYILENGNIVKEFKTYKDFTEYEKERKLNG